MSFVDNLVTIFSTERGTEILRGKIKPFIKFLDQYCKEYTSNLIQEQSLNPISEAWNNKDYKNLIEKADRLGIEALSDTLKMKYKIAKKSFLDNK